MSSVAAALNARRAAEGGCARWSQIQGWACWQALKMLAGEKYDQVTFLKVILAAVWTTDYES